jgi:glucokinase
MTLSQIVPLSPNSIVAAVDLGGTKIFAGIVTSEGAILTRLVEPSRDLAGRPAALLDRMAEMVRLAAAEAGVPFEQLAAVGVGVPGSLDLERAVVDVAPNIEWVQVPARDELAARLPGKPVFLENDVRAAALAEHRLGAGVGTTSMLAVLVGTGVGGGIILGGRLYHGSGGGAGEIGHMVIKAGGPRCGCGQIGCLEALAAREAVAGYVERAVARGRRTVLTGLVAGELSTLTSQHLAAAISAGDAVAVRAAQESARYVGIAIGSVVNLLDPQLVVLGGGIVEALGQPYVDWAAAHARPNILARAARDLPIVAATLGANVGLLGAAYTAFAGLADENPTTILPDVR